MNTILKNRGFTLIEVIIAITISMGIVLLVSYSLKFFINSWNKSKEIFLINQKYLLINSLITAQYNSIVSFKYLGKIFFKGDSNSLIFITQNSGTVYTGINEVGYYFNEDKNMLKICFNEISKPEEIVDYEVLKEEGKCIDIEGIDSIKFQYLTKKNDEPKEEADGVIPINITAMINFIENNEKIVEEEININYYE